MDEMGKALFPNLPEERPWVVLAMKKLSVYLKKCAVLYEGLEKTLKILSLVYNDKGYVCSLYLYVKIELDKEWLYEKIYSFA